MKLKKVVTQLERLFFDSPGISDSSHTKDQETKYFYTGTETKRFVKIYGPDAGQPGTFVSRGEGQCTRLHVFL